MRCSAPWAPARRYNAFPDSRRSLTGGPPEDALIAEVDAQVAYAPQTRRIPTLSFLAARTAGLRVDPWPAAVPIEFREPGAIRTVSAADVLAGRTPPGALRGKLVLVGTSAPQAGDLRRTPARRRVPGVEIHANAILTAAAQARRPARDILLIAALALFPVLLFRARPVVAALGVAGAAVAYLVVAQLWFGAGRIVPVVVPLGALLASAAGLALARTLAARRARGASRGVRRARGARGRPAARAGPRARAAPGARRGLAPRYPAGGASAGAADGRKRPVRGVWSSSSPALPSSSSSSVAEEVAPSAPAAMTSSRVRASAGALV